MKPLALMGVLTLAGCAVGPSFRAPAAPDTSTYTHDAQPATTVAANGTAQTFVPIEKAPTMWWTQFHSDPLNRFVDTALQQSPTLAQARAKLLQAREDYAAEAGATEYPAIDAKLSGERQKVDIAQFGIPNIPNPGPFTLYDASVSVTYTLDVFGANRRALEALKAQVDYQAYEFDAARLTLAGNVVSTAIRRASLQQQITLTQRLADTQAQQLAITEKRFAAGGVAQLDVHSQRTLLAQTRASLPPLATQLAQADHQLAILLGEPPSKADFGDLTLDALHLPKRVPLTLPSTLARERPDIRASEALLHQASANVGVATANLYPQFTLAGGVGSERPRIRDIVKGLNIWNAGLNLTQPIFHGGELRAKKRSAQAAYDAALAGYQQTVLQGLQQVADTLTALQNDASELQARDDAAQQAQASLAIAQTQYSVGGISQFGRLDAERQALQTKLYRTQAQASRLADTTALFQSLGGEW
ncbi:histidine kinase [Dyella lipolytica]|uniref:Efflux transporter outer membrane subunit n=1 Tax=Dyella lipolytica TaxID=1867835 RepID=A0ABW8IXJ7_9GAMM|nr:efflux transporter outer membrane subunit [Dyella lipolytica]GLQ45977.1 histidine kinase [Dyella lipolytica]